VAHEGKSPAERIVELWNKRPDRAAIVSSLGVD
jgi:hypothetical protein